MNHDNHAKKRGRHHGTIISMFRQDHGMIMARSWYGRRIFLARVVIPVLQRKLSGFCCLCEL